MSTYEGFAGIYDRAMDNIPYHEWCEDICRYLQSRGIESGTICDLGCGTGMMTELLSDKGYQLIGIDLSENMLQIAMDKKMEHSRDIMYIHQDMRELELHGGVDAIVSVCDSMNYMMSEPDMMQVFLGAHKYLKPNGVFLFDMKTEYCYKYVMGNQVWTEQTEDCSYIWENYYYEENQTNEYMLTIFQKQKDSELYERSEESHYQRAYDVETLKKMLKEAGFELDGIYGDKLGEPMEQDSERIHIVAHPA